MYSPRAVLFTKNLRNVAYSMHCSIKRASCFVGLLNSAAFIAIVTLLAAWESRLSTQLKSRLSVYLYPDVCSITRHQWSLFVELSCVLCYRHCMSWMSLGN